MNPFPEKQYNNQFGSLEIGRILFDKVKDYPKLHRKLANFIEQTWKIKETIDFCNLEVNTKNFVQLSVNQRRFWQLQNDIIIEHPEKEDILNRMSYLIKRGRC